MLYLLKFIEIEEHDKDPEKDFLRFIDRLDCQFRISSSEFNSSMAWMDYRKDFSGEGDIIISGDYLKLRQERFSANYDNPLDITDTDLQFVQLWECTFLKLITKNGELKHDFT